MRSSGLTYGFFDHPVSQMYKDARIKCLEKTSSNSSSSSEPLAEKETITEDALSQEVFYNTGRAFHELKLHGLAARCYCDCLEVADRHPAWTGQGGGNREKKHLHVTRQAAHNYTLLLRANGSNDEAYTVMAKYLTL